MWLLSLLFLGLVASTAASKCGVTEDFLRSMQESRSRALQENVEMRFQRDPSSTSPIRIWVDYVSLAGLTLAQQTRLQTVIFPNALNWFSNVLSVSSILTKLTLSQAYCGEVQIPESHRLVGVEADFILYVFTKNSSDGSVAAAAACEFDGLTGSPVAGMMQYDPTNYITMNLENEIQIARHEIMHALGFSADLYSSYRQPDGTLYDIPVLNLTSSSFPEFQIATPNVLENAQFEFDCGTVTGVPLQYTGNMAPSSHWDKSIMFNDFMNPTFNVPDVIYSDISLAVLDDSGWYTVNYEYTDSVSYGFGEGCGWIDDPCANNGVAQFPEFCNSADTDTCDYLNLRKGSCSLVTYTSALPTPYQYFSNSHIGGADPYTDYCPYVIPNVNGDCRGQGLVVMTPNSNYGERIGVTSRCFLGNYTLDSSSTTMHTACYNITCDPTGTAYVTVGAVTIACPVPGGPANVTGFTSTIICPPYDLLCTPPPCLNGCSGNGKCLDGCDCDPGYDGVDCSLVCDDTCLSCSGSGNNQCTGCYNNAHIVSGTCVCDVGYEYDDVLLECVKVQCYSACQTCTGTTSTSCTSCWGDATLSALGDCSCNAGFYTTADFQCGECDVTCQSCSGPSANECLSCPGNLVLNNDATCGCANTATLVFNPYLQLCISSTLICDPSCQTCSGTALNTCTSCVLNATLTEGVCACNPHYIFNAAMKPYTCIRNFLCDKTCQTCYGPSPSECLSCVSGLSQKNGICVCPTGYNFNTVTLHCDQTFSCDPSCLTCTGTLSTQCSSCNPNFLLVKNTCTCPKTGFVLVGSSCSSCHPSCSSCSGTTSNTCISCSIGASLNGNSCSCNTGYYLSNSVCTPCASPCASCSNGNTCTTCKATNANNVNGVCTCSSQNYLTTDGTTCLPCDPNCLTCSGASNSACTTCFPGMSLNNNQCVCLPGSTLSSPGICETCLSSCKTCGSDPTVCASCDTSVATLVNGKCNCLSSAYRTVTSQCRPCDSSCLTCFGGNSDQCLTCTSHAGLRKGVCLCMTGYSWDAGFKQCVKCDPSCATCVASTANDCTSCKPNADIPTGKLRGPCTCEEGLFMNVDTCQWCSSACKTCSGPSAVECTTCTTGLSLPPGQTVGDCSSRKLVDTVKLITEEEAECSGYTSNELLKGVSALGVFLVALVAYSELSMRLRKSRVAPLQEVGSEPSIWRLILETHFLLGLFFHSAALLRWSKVTMLLSALLCELAVFSYFYEEGTELAVGYALVAGMSVSTVQLGLLSLKRKWGKGLGLVLALATAAVSWILVSAEMCASAGSVVFLWGFGELLMSEVLLGAFRALVIARLY